MNKLELISTAIERALLAGLVPNLIGPPGIGKSSVIKAVADSLNLLVIDCRLSTMDPTDLGGLPNFVKSVNPVTGDEIVRVSHLPNTKFPLQDLDDLPPKYDANGKQIGTYDGWLIFFDEITSAPQLVKAACYQILLDREVCGKPLHDCVAMVAAGNRETDGAIASKLGTALENRLITIPMDADKDGWLDWATNANMDIRITSYVKWKPDSITKFNANHGDINFSSCRSLEFVQRILDESNGVIDDVAKLLIKGALGNATGTEFLGFCDYYKEIPDINDIVKDPVKTPVPEGIGHQYALAGVLATAMDSKNGAAIIQYAQRIGKEFQVVMAGDACKRNPSLMGIPQFSKWIDDNTNLLNAEI